MSRVLAVGIATLDIVNTVDGYPAEDAEVRALGQRVARGGNAANTLAVLSQLGHQGALAAVLSDEPTAALVRADLARQAIDTGPCRTIAGGHLPTSYITLNRRNGSRTIVHFRDLPEYTAEDFAALALDAYDWVHFEGRNLPTLGAMLRRARAAVRPGVPLSLEIEKPRPGIEELLPLPDVLFFSRAYALAKGHTAPEAFLEWARTQAPRAQLFLGWGAEGAYVATGEGAARHVPAAPPPAVIDTVGAGDVLNAGIIDGLLRRAEPEGALRAAVRLAGAKCGQLGLAGLVGSR
ncbi:ketohexokinase [Ectothiorhodospiraceae bacterium 2226]|nr:ketohexokinase [Ectothiorhodospiraceae bacterium 2226]